MAEIKQQLANLKQLADYLAALPEDYDHFDMRYYAYYTSYVGAEILNIDADFYNKCGTAACAVGHGPAAGIQTDGYNSWMEYAVENFIPEDNDDVFTWLFDEDWAFVDNTPNGAAKRIYWYLKHGRVPDDFRSQITSEEPLCYE